MVEMVHYVSWNQDGTVHVQNAIMGMLGQHHVHTPEGFEAWLYPSASVETLEGATDCPCGLSAGEMRDGGPRA